MQTDPLANVIFACLVAVAIWLLWRNTPRTK